MVAFQKPGMKQEIIVVTSEQTDALSAQEIVEPYRHRWQVELFFPNAWCPAATDWRKASKG